MPSARSGCGNAAARSGDFLLHATDGRGVAREYRVLVPALGDAGTPLALTFVYHGAGGDERGAMSYGLQSVPGAAQASIFVFPRGVAFESHGVGWNDRCSGYDMSFFDHMLAQLRSSYCIDDRRIFAAGFSWGGDHVTSLACCRGSEVRAIAAAACSDEFDDATSHASYQNTPCPSRGTTAIRFTFDPNGDSALSAQQFKTTSALYRALNGCSATEVPEATPCVTYQGCAKPFVACGQPGLGHALPASWAADTWAFFASQR
jgi:poly(3-hydroxybutyrate) depolymerase